MVDYPVKVTFEYPEKLSRGLAALKFFLGAVYVGIPHGIILWLYGIAVSVVSFIVFWIILFTGTYPRSLFDFIAGFVRWSARVSAYWPYLMTDKYPPFTGEE